MINLKYLEWDSEFFDKKIYRCDLKNHTEIQLIEKELENLNGDLCYVFSDEELKSANSRKFFLADKKIIFEKELFSRELTENDKIHSSKMFTKQLLALALLSGHYSRFKKDPELSPKFADMYKTWLEKSLTRQIADEVFVAEIEKVELGFITIKKNNQVGTVGLIAVNELKQGQNIGSLLLKTAENWCIDNDVNKLEVATQMDNIQACNFYKKNNYVVKQIEFIYHFYRK